MTEDQITIDFYDVGYPTGQGTCGCFNGTVTFDHFGDIEEFTIEALKKGERDRRFIMPKTDQILEGDNLFAYNLGNQIRADYDQNIKDALYEQAVQKAEEGFARGRSDREEHSTLRVVRGRIG